MVLPLDVTLRSEFILRTLRLATVIALLTTPSEAAAQVFAVKAGVSFSNLALSADHQLYIPARHPGFVAGVSFTQQIHQVAGIEIDGLVNLRDGIQGDGLKLTYLEVPILTRVMVWRSDNRGVFVVGGPQFASGLFGHHEAEAVGPNQGIGRKLNHFEAGLALGVGVELSRLILDIRHTWAFTGAFVEGDPGEDVKTRTFSVMAGYRLGK